MATYKAEYFKFDEGSNKWDLYYFKTSADLIVETTSNKVLTSEERTKISNFLTTFNTTDKLVRVGSDGKILVDLVPDLSATYLTKNSPSFTGTLSGYTGRFNGINAYNSTNNRLEIGSRLQEQDSTYITFKDNQEGKGEMELYAHAGIKLSSNTSVIDVSNNWIRNVREPMQGHEAVNKEYVDNKVSSGFTTRSPVKAASTGNIDITTALNTLDGFTSLSAGDTVLLKNQTTASQNGVYALDASKKPQKVTGDSKLGSAVFVEHGDTNNDYIYHCSTENTWVAFSKPDTIKAGAGLSKSGTTLSIPDGAVTNGMLAGGISSTKLDEVDVNSFVLDYSNTTQVTETGYGSDYLNNLFSSLFSVVKLLRGTTKYNTDNEQTIAGAYTNAAAAQTTASNAMAAIPNITSGSGNPSTSGAKNGDLYFKELSTV